MKVLPSLGGARQRASAVAVVLAATGIAFAYEPAASAAISTVPAVGTPSLAPNHTVERVRQLVRCRGTMYAVGAFTRISSHGTVYLRNRAFSFKATAPFTLTSWKPNVNGVVNSIALNSNCTVAYLGGKFSSVHGTAARNIAAVNTSTGALIPKFDHFADGQVETVRLFGSHLLTGGYFTSINNSSRHKYFASLNATTGADDGFLNLNISGNYHFCGPTQCSAPDPTRVYNQQISHGGNFDLVEGVFTSVGGLPRQQIFMLNLGGAHATVTKWTSFDFFQNCYYNVPFYIRSAAWAPNDATVYIAATGYHLQNWNHHFPLSGLCDAASAFPAAQTLVGPKWINWTGCDSLYSAVASSATVFFAGHERWSQNPYGCDHAGPGAISAPGIEGLSPATGRLIFNPTRGRGFGADDMVLYNSGLWIASDNFDGTSQCGGRYGYAGICLLPNN